jgi:DNA invertase Pin-like site-specific DNA recombinase
MGTTPKGRAPSKTTAKRAIIYTRVSRDDSGEGKSNERQESDCRKLADLRGWEVIRVESDISVSAYSGKARPSWQRVLNAVEAGEVDLVLAWHLDRMTRSMTDLEELILLGEDHGVGVATVSGDIDLTTDVGRMVARILAAVARAEVERKSARQKLANRQRAAEGIPWSSGFRAFGYLHDGAQVPDEAEAIRQAADDALAGAPMVEIARRWTAAGLRSPNSSSGAAWTSRGVKSVLINPRNAGISTYRGEELGQGAWEPIYDRATHELLVAMLTDPSRRTNSGKGGRLPQNLLTGIAACAKCGESVNGRNVNGTPAYACARGCVGTPRDEVDALVRNAITMTIRMTLPGTLTQVPNAGRDPELWEEREALRARRDLLAELLGSQAMTEDEWRAARGPVVARLAEVENQLEEDHQTLVDVSELGALSAEAFAAMPLREQRDALKQLQATITLYPKGRGRRNVSIQEQVEMRVTPLRRERAKRDETLARLFGERGGSHDHNRSILILERSAPGSA